MHDHCPSSSFNEVVIGAHLPHNDIWSLPLKLQFTANSLRHCGLDRRDDDGRRRYTGTLKDVGENGIAIEIDEEIFCVRFQEIGVARLAPRIDV